MDSQAPPGIHDAGIFDVFRILVRHWRLVLAVCLPVVAAAVVWSLVMTKTYRATASIVPPMSFMQGGDLGAAGGLLGGAEGALLRKAMSTGSPTDMYVGILESQAVVGTLVDRFNLTEVYDCPGRRWAALDRLQANTGVRVGEEGIVEISVVDKDPNLAAAIANAYVDELDRQNKRLSAGQATSKRLFLENRLKEIEEKFSRIETIPTHEARVQEMLYELLIREYEMAKIEEAKSMPTIQVLDEAVPPQKKFKPQRKQMVMMAGAGSFTLAVFLAFFLEHREESRQTGLARQFQRATRWRRAVARQRAGRPGDNGSTSVVEQTRPGDGRLVTKS